MTRVVKMTMAAILTGGKSDSSGKGDKSGKDDRVIILIGVIKTKGGPNLI